MRKCTARKFKSRFAGTFFITALLIFSCSSSAPSISNDEKEAYINTYVDLTLIQIGDNTSKKTFSRAEERVFERYGTSRQFLEEFTEKLSSRPELQAEVYQEISRKLKEFNDLPVDSIGKIVKEYLSPEKEK